MRCQHEHATVTISDSVYYAYTLLNPLKEDAAVDTSDSEDSDFEPTTNTAIEVVCGQCGKEWTYKNYKNGPGWVQTAYEKIDAYRNEE